MAFKVLGAGRGSSKDDNSLWIYCGIAFLIGSLLPDSVNPVKFIGKFFNRSKTPSDNQGKKDDTKK